MSLISRGQENSGRASTGLVGPVADHTESATGHRSSEGCLRALDADVIHGPFRGREGSFPRVYHGGRRFVMEYLVCPE